MMPLILVVGLEQVFIIQILMPNKRDKSIFLNSCFGAAVGILLNILLVKRMLAVGSAIVWIASETVVLVAAAHFSRKEDGIGFPWKTFGKMLLAYAPSLVLAILLYSFIPAPMVRLAAVTALMGIYAAIYILFIRKDETVLSLITWKK